MLLKKVKNRLSILVALLLISISTIFLILKVLDDNVLYFYSPSDIKNSNEISFKKKIRIGNNLENGFELLNKKIRKIIIITFWNNKVRILKFLSLFLLRNKNREENKTKMFIHNKRLPS